MSEYIAYLNKQIAYFKKLMKSTNVQKMIKLTMNLNEILFIKINELDSFFDTYVELKTRFFRAKKSFVATIALKILMLETSSEIVKMTTIILILVSSQTSKTKTKTRIKIKISRMITTKIKKTILFATKNEIATKIIATNIVKIAKTILLH